VKKVFLGLVGWTFMVTTVAVVTVFTGVLSHAGYELLKFGWDLI
jgi:hypothetical protein